MEKFIVWNQEHSTVTNVLANIFVLLICFGLLSGCTQAMLRIYEKYVYESRQISQLVLTLTFIMVIAGSVYNYDVDIFLLWAATTAMLTFIFIIQQRLLYSLCIFDNVYFLAFATMIAIYYYCIYTVSLSLYVVLSAIVSAMGITCFGMPHILRKIYVCVFKWTQDIATIIFVDEEEEETGY